MMMGLLSMVASAMKKPDLVSRPARFLCDAALREKRAPEDLDTFDQAAASNAEVSNTLLIGGRFMIIG